MISRDFKSLNNVNIFVNEVYVEMKNNTLYSKDDNRVIVSTFTLKTCFCQNLTMNYDYLFLIHFHVKSRSL